MRRIGTTILAALTLAAAAGHAAGSQDATPWRALDAATSDGARAERRPLLLLVTPPCGAVPALDTASSSLIASSFDAVRVDALTHPDVADLATLSLVALDAPDEPPAAEPVLVALLPDGRPFAARRGMGGSDGRDLLSFLQRTLTAYREAGPALELQARRAASALLSGQHGPPPRTLSPARLDAAPSALARRLSEAQGAPDGPALRPPALLFLLRHHARTGDARSLATALLGLRRHAAAPALRTGELSVLAQGALLAVAATRDPELQRLANDSLSRLMARQKDSGAIAACEGGAMVGQDAGLALQALVAAGDDRSRAAAERLAGALHLLGPASALRRSTEGGVDATLDDHAQVAAGLLDLHEAGGASGHILTAQAIADAALGALADPGGGALFATGAPAPLFGVRTRNGYDDALPAGNATMVRVLRRLGTATGEMRYDEMSRRLSAAFAGPLEDGVFSLASLAGEIQQPWSAPAPSSPVATDSLRAVQGGVSLELLPPASGLRAGAAFEARLALVAGPGWAVVAPGARFPLFGMTVSVPGVFTLAGPPDFPPTFDVPASGAAPGFAALPGGREIRIPLRVPADLVPGPTRLQVRVRFQACQGPRCADPETALLSLPVAIGPRQ